MIKRLTGCCLLALSVSTVNAQTVEQATDLLNEWLAAQADYNDYPSISVAMVHGDEVVYKNAFGYANREKKVKATTETLYSICSISKLFTSVAVMQQRDAGKLSLRDPVSKHLDWYNIEQRFELSDKVSVQGILTHSSGLPREVDVPYWSLSEGHPFPERDAAIKTTQSQSTLYRAWEHFQYSNLGLTLAGEIVASVSGKDFHTYISERILKPLDMQNTYSSMPEDLHGGALAVGYGALPRRGERAEIPFFNAKGIDPAAGFASNVEDLAKFASWQLSLVDGEGKGVLDHNTLREMYRPHSVITNWQYAWGLGFSIRNTDRGTLVGHGGSCPGYRSQLSILPGENAAAVAMINAGGTNPYAYADNLFNILLPVLGEATEENEEERPNGLEEYKGIYDSQPWGDEIYVTPWGEDVIGVRLSSDNPMEDKFTLQHVDGDEFVVIRNGEAFEPVVFLRDDDGQVNGYLWHSTITRKRR